MRVQRMFHGETTRIPFTGRAWFRNVKNILPRIYDDLRGCSSTLPGRRLGQAGYSHRLGDFRGYPLTSSYIRDKNSSFSDVASDSELSNIRFGRSLARRRRGVSVVRTGNSETPA
jgi:hypothetical protein